jgi:hypothetical protein
VTDLFIDTSAWMAIVDVKDANHQAASAFQDGIDGGRRLVVTNYILDELLTLVLMDLGYRSAVDIKSKLDRLWQDGILDVVWVDSALADSAWSVFERFNQDKRWSFTDCVSFAVMKSRAITEAFAFDHHFEQMGFVRRP